MTRLALRAGARAMKQALRPPPKARKTTALKSTSGKPALAKRTHAKPTPTKRAPTSGSPSASACASAGQWSTGVALSAGGARRYRLYKPPGVRRTERLPLVVMLHGCAQDAQALAASTKMNRIAQRERFLVLYPEQDRLANLQGCWDWYDTRSGRAQREADSIDAAINQVCLKQPVDPNCIALAGLSAGASLAALLAVRRPERFRAIVMHSGIAPGVATSSATALGAMRGRRVAAPHWLPWQPALILPHCWSSRAAPTPSSRPAMALGPCVCGPIGRARRQARRARCNAAHATRPPSPTIARADGWSPPCATSRGWGTPGAAAQRAALTATPKGRTLRA